jgi:hypothetical protein
MSHVKKPTFEQFRHEVIGGGRPLLEKNVAPIQAAILERLNGISELLIEKSRRLPHPEGMIEISAKWFGLDSSQDTVLRTLKKEWPEEEMGAIESMYCVLPSEEAVLVLFAGTYDDRRYVTGRMLVTF